MEGVWQTATKLLRVHYGDLALLGPLQEWTTLVKVVLTHGRVSNKRAVDWSWLKDSPLASSRLTAETRAEQLAESLEAAGQAGAKASVLYALAKWFEAAIGENTDSLVLEQSNLEKWRDELRGIRGVNVELADRILLFVAGLAAYPIDRASIRIACRHGWMDLNSEYDEWQAFFVRGMEGDANELARLSLWNARVGKDFCGPRPACEECPLKPLLPERGPTEMDE